MPKENFPGNDGYTKEFLWDFWDSIKTIWASELKSTFNKGNQNHLQRQVVKKNYWKER